MIALAHRLPGGSGLTLFIDKVGVQRLLDILEQDAEAEGVCHFAEEGHGSVSFEGVNGADRAARVCSVYDSSHDPFRRLRGISNDPEAGRAAQNDSPHHREIGVSA